MIIYHITDQIQWAKYYSATYYLPSNYETDGFIHCSNGEQVLVVAEKYYAAASQLLLLKIDEQRVSSPVVYENLEGGEEKYPHIYGQLDKQAILGVAIFGRDAEGFFHLPDFT